MKYDLQTLRGDIFGGITAAVVGLPVALAFGVASGLGAIAGLYGAIAVGFFTAVFGGTRSQISGPTGPMAVMMAVIVTSHASNLSEAFTITVMAGLIQTLLGLMRIGRLVAYTPYSVISGFMSGIGGNHHIAADPALPRSCSSDRRLIGDRSRVAGCGERHQRRRVCYRISHPCRGRSLAGPPQEISTANPCGTDCRHTAGCLVVE